jgi:hypothetical protein
MQTEASSSGTNTNEHITSLINDEKSPCFQDTFDWSSTYEANDASRY